MGHLTAPGIKNLVDSHVRPIVLGRFSVPLKMHCNSEVAKNVYINCTIYI